MKAPSNIGEQIGATIGTALKTGSPITQVTEGLNAVSDLVGRFVPDVNQRQANEFEALKAIQNVNAIEAAHPSIFVAGWRPFIGWVCGSGLAFQWVMRPLLNWLLLLIPRDIPPLPGLNTSEIVGLLVPLLGLAGYRTYEKVKGKSRDSLEGAKRFKLFNREKAS